MTDGPIEKKDAKGLRFAPYSDKRKPEEKILIEKIPKPVKTKGCIGKALTFLSAYRSAIVTMLAPLVFAPIFYFFDSSEGKCAYVVFVMGVYWVLEVLPLAVTALIPMIALPILGIMRSDDVARNYLPDTGFLFIGGLMVAVAVEKSNLHVRMALFVLSICGSNPVWIMFGFMIVCFTLSMFISNTATAALMVPIVQQVINELVENAKAQQLASFAARTHLQNRRRSIEGRRLSLNADTASLVSPQAKKNGGSEEHTMRTFKVTKVTEHIHIPPPELPTIGEGSTPKSSRNGSSRRLDDETDRETDAGGSSSDVQIDPAEEERLIHEQDLHPTIHRMNDFMEHISQMNDQTTQENKEIASGYKPAEKSMAKGLLISICYSANIGGASTLTGTASNLVLMGQLDSLFPGGQTNINFLTWLIYAFPMSLACLLITWLIIVFKFMRHAPKGSAAITAKLKQKYRALPPMSFAEGSVMVCFFVLLILWITRDPKFLPGFASFFPSGYVSDTTSAILVVILLFCLPEERPTFKRMMAVIRDKARRKTSKAGAEPNPKPAHRSLLEWQNVTESFPWSVVFLLGGGFALAAGVKKSGLSAAIGGIMNNLGIFKPMEIMIIVVTITLVLTNICSNTVVASIFIPIVAELAKTLRTNPLYYMLPVTLSSSHAFLLPVATPPNAIVFSTGVLSVPDMVTTGILVTLVNMALAVLNQITIGRWLFDLDQFPIWGLSKEERAAANMTDYMTTTSYGGNDTLLLLST